MSDTGSTGDPQLQLKVLLVEDDSMFRTVLRKSLEKKNCVVSEASNGKVAREALILQKYDLVISDIQMPHFTGIELIEWIKENSAVPVVLMTGFSQALETKKAHHLGAAGFLAKPFKESDLQETLRQFMRSDPSPIIPSDANLDPQYCKVAIEEFLSDKESACSIYMRISNSKFIKIAHCGGKISDDRIKAYRDKGINFVYVKREDFYKIVRFNLQIAKVAKGSAQISEQKKLSFIMHTGDLILEHAFVNGVDSEAFHESVDFVKTSMDVLARDDQIFTVLDLLSNHADFLYAHSLGVSIFSVMIGRELDWAAPSTLFKLSLGGLLHDIGKKEITREILEKPRPLLTQKERNLIETHATRGKEILESLPAIPSEVCQIAYQHHEDIAGQGFPQRLSKSKIHPLAKVVQVANVFCEYAVKYRPEVTPLPAHTALDNMERLKSEILDPTAFAALKKLFGS